MKLGIDFKTDIYTAITRIIQDELGNDAPVQIQGDDESLIVEFSDNAGEDPTDEQNAVIKKKIEDVIVAHNKIATVTTISTMPIEQVEK